MATVVAWFWIGQFLWNMAAFDHMCLVLCLLPRLIEPTFLPVSVPANCFYLKEVDYGTLFLNNLNVGYTNKLIFRQHI